MEDWARLGEYVTSARVAAGHRSRASFADACGVSERTLDKLECGQRVSAATLAAVEPHLGWGPGASRRVLDGGEPHPDGSGPGPPDPAALIAALPPELQEPAAGFLAAVAKYIKHTTSKDAPGKT